MRIIHFTAAAADPLNSFDATGASFLPPLEGQRNSHFSCLHLNSGAKVLSPSLTHAAALLVVHGRITMTTEIPKIPSENHYPRRHGRGPRKGRGLFSDLGGGRYCVDYRIRPVANLSTRDINPSTNCRRDVAERCRIRSILKMATRMAYLASRRRLPPALQVRICRPS